VPASEITDTQLANVKAAIRFRTSEFHNTGTRRVEGLTIEEFLCTNVPTGLSLDTNGPHETAGRAQIVPEDDSPTRPPLLALAAVMHSIQI
jgi:hypothetical protein